MVPLCMLDLSRIHFFLHWTMQILNVTSTLIRENDPEYKTFPKVVMNLWWQNAACPLIRWNAPRFLFLKRRRLQGRRCSSPPVCGHGWWNWKPVLLRVKHIGQVDDVAGPWHSEMAGWQCSYRWLTRHTQWHCVPWCECRDDANPYPHKRSHQTQPQSWKCKNMRAGDQWMRWMVPSLQTNRAKCWEFIPAYVMNFQQYSVLTAFLKILPLIT